MGHARSADQSRVLLVRNAAAEPADHGRLRGRSDVALTLAGRAQAAKLARALGGLPIDRLLTSPLVRARETADAIASTIGVLPALDERLIDVDTGRWTGLTEHDAITDDPIAFDRYRRFPQAARFPGGESMPDAERRVLRALADLHGSKSRLTVVVSHELPIRLVLARLRGDDGSWMWYPPLPPTSQIEVRVDGNGVFLPTVLEGLFRESAERVRRRWHA
jgi:broad specificity phosphatase PhoE